MQKQALHIKSFLLFVQQQKIFQAFYIFPTKCTKLDHATAANVNTAVEIPSPRIVIVIVTDDSCSLCRNHNADVGSASRCQPCLLTSFRAFSVTEEEGPYESCSSW